ncbi:hypothetical protein P7C73_g736, partial [Tremellales sp. Uapishka_1]
MSNPRRSYPPRPRTASMTLDSVPEDSHTGLRPLPPSAFRSQDRRASSSGTGRARVSESSGRSGAASPGPDAAQRRKRAEWVVDLVQTQKGAETWSEAERVVLIIGNPTADSIAPLLYNPAFSSTLLLVALSAPSPSIESLQSPAHLLTMDPIYPTIQTFTCSDIDGAHPLPGLIAQASALAYKYRNPVLGGTPKWSRRPSATTTDSSPSSTPPSTPPATIRTLPNVGTRRDSGNMSPSLSGPDLPRRGSLVNMPDALSRTRMPSFSKDGFFGSKKVDAPESKAQLTVGSPFDAVLNFVAPASSFPAARALSDMLQQAVVLTSGIMPTLLKRSAIKVPKAAPLPISLLHILPLDTPGPLPSIIESFLLSLLPSMQTRGDRKVFGSVITSSVWLAPESDLGPDSHAPGAEILLFGGVQCPSPASGEGESKPRAFLSSWGQCRAPVLASSSGSERRRSEPFPLSYVDPSTDRTPTASPQPTLKSSGYSRSRLSEVALPSDMADPPSTPELSHSTSSCSSSLALGEVRTSVDEKDGRQGKKKRGFFGWLSGKKNMV